MKPFGETPEGPLIILTIQPESNPLAFVRNLYQRKGSQELPCWLDIGNVAVRDLPKFLVKTDPSSESVELLKYADLLNEIEVNARCGDNIFGV